VQIDRRNLHRNYWQEIRDDKDLMPVSLHPVKFTEEMFFGNRVKVSRELEPIVCSIHHQAINELSPAFSATATSYDGKIVEGIAHKKYPNVFSVQFHPEIPDLYMETALLRFAPEDTPATVHSILGKESQEFHIKYWEFISGVIGEQASK
jgi:putative glutamine amidotransferase